VPVLRSDGGGRVSVDVVSPPGSRHLTVQQIAKHYGVTQRLIYALMDAGKLPYTRWNSRRTVAVDDLERYLAQNRVGPTA